MAGTIEQLVKPKKVGRGSRLTFFMPKWRNNGDLWNTLGTQTEIDTILAYMRGDGRDAPDELQVACRTALDDSLSTLVESIRSACRLTADDTLAALTDSTRSLTGSLALATSDKILLGSRAAPLVKDYRVNSSEERADSLLVIPTAKITGVIALPQTVNLQLLRPTLDIRVQSSQDNPSYIYQAHRDPGQRVTENASLGHWYRFPLESVELTMLAEPGLVGPVQQR